jgi:hypothetical protein
MEEGEDRARSRWRRRAGRRRWIRRERHPLRFALAALVLLLAAVLTLAWVARRELAERWLLAQLAARGATPAALAVTRLDRRGFEIADVALGPADLPDLTLAHLEASWSWTGLRAPRFDALALTGARLRGAQGDDGLRFGAADGLLRGDGGGSADGEAAPAPALLPAPEISLRDGAFELALRDGIARGMLAGALRSEADGTLAGNAELAVEHPLAHAEGTVVLSGTLADLAGELDLALRDAREPARVAPATLRGRLSGAAKALRFDVQLEGANGNLRARLAGDADLPARNASADFELAPVTFAVKGLQPQTLVPALEAVLDRSTLSKMSGQVSARGSLALRGGEPTIRLDVTLRDVGFESRFARVAGVAGTLALRGPRWQTPEGQKLRVATLHIGVPLTDGALEFQLRPTRALAVRRTSWQFAGGELSANDVVLELGAARTEVRMLANGLELGALLALVSLEGIDGTGRIDGELPFVREGGATRVEQAVLRARPEGGKIQYAPTPAIAQYAAARPNDLGLAVTALSDFHYEKLEASVDGELDGELHVELHLRGANPALKDGHPIELNLSLDAEVSDVVRSGRAAYGVPKALEERLRKLQGEEKK